MYVNLYADTNFSEKQNSSTFVDPQVHTAENGSSVPPKRRYLTYKFKRRCYLQHKTSSGIFITIRSSDLINSPSAKILSLLKFSNYLARLQDDATSSWINYLRFLLRLDNYRNYLYDAFLNWGYNTSTFLLREIRSFINPSVLTQWKRKCLWWLQVCTSSGV